MKILIVDDHALFRDGLRQILPRLGANVHISEAWNAETALQSDWDDFDLILLDIQLPGMNGLQALKAFRERFPASPVVVVSGVFDPQKVRDGLAAGAQGFIPKSFDAEYLLTALRHVCDGELWIPDEQAPQSPSRCPPDTPGLTRRQMEVLGHLCDGRSNKEIGRILDMSENTVRSHVANILQALGAKSRTEAAMIARRNGWR